MGKALVWLSYDLGVGGDYDGLYELLDSYGAKECGDSLAVFYYEYSENPEEELRNEMLQKAKVGKEDRIYAVFVYRVEGRLKVVGKFLHGRRRIAPWRGYSKQEQEEMIEDNF